MFHTPSLAATIPIVPLSIALFLSCRKARIAAYAVRTGKTEDEAKVAFAAWLKDEFGVVDMATEDEYLLNEWAEMFVIETRNLGASGGGGRGNNGVPRSHLWSK